MSGRPSLHSYRLTEADEARIRSTINDTLHDFRRLLDGYPKLDNCSEVTESLRHVACQAISVTTADLRDVELAWLDAQISTAIDRQPDNPPPHQQGATR